MKGFDGNSFVDGLISNNIISILEEEGKTYTKDFKLHIKNELYRVVGNEVGKALLFDLVNIVSEVQGGSPIVVEAIDIDDDEKWLGPQTSKRMDGKIHVMLYNLADHNSVEAEKEVSSRNRMYGFPVDVQSCDIIGDPCLLNQIDTPEQHVTLFHELNHARVLVRSLIGGDNPYKFLERATVKDGDNGFLCTPIKYSLTNSIVKNIFGNSDRSGMEEFQSIGITSGTYSESEPWEVCGTTVMKEGVWRDPICEGAYMIADAKARGLRSCMIRYPYVVESEERGMCFVKPDSKREILKKVLENLKQIEEGNNE